MNDDVMLPILNRMSRHIVHVTFFQNEAQESLISTEYILLRQFYKLNNEK